MDVGLRLLDTRDVPGSFRSSDFRRTVLGDAARLRRSNHFNASRNRSHSICRCRIATVEREEGGSNMSRRRNRDGTRRENRERTEEVRESEFRDWMQRFNSLETPENEDARLMMDMHALVDVGYDSYMCMLHYCSPYFNHDPEETARWALIGTENGDQWSADWLLYLLAREGSAPQFAYGNDIGRHPGFKILKELAGLGDMRGIDWIPAERCEGGFDNGVFMCTSDGEGGRFVFYPTGFETGWGRADQDLVADTLTGEEADRMLDACIDSLVAEFSRDSPESARGISPGMRDRLIRALDLPLDPDYMGYRSVQCASSIRLDIVFGSDDSYVLEVSSDGRASVDGRQVRIPDADSKRILYAACLATRRAWRFYGDRCEGSPEWKLRVRGSRGTWEYGGTVLPRFMDALALALHRCEQPSVRECSDALGFFPSIPTEGILQSDGLVRLALISRRTTVRERALCDPFETQDVIIEYGSTSVGVMSLYSEEKGMCISEEELGEGAIRDLLELFDDLPEISYDPACPWSVKLDYESDGMNEVSGPSVRKGISAVLESIGGRGAVNGKIRDDMREKGFEGADDAGFKLFDELDGTYPDYYGLRGLQGHRP